jgi:hypothetical protein
VLVEEGVDSVLHLGPGLHQLDAVAEELPTASLFLVGDARAEHVDPEQPCQGLGVDLIRLHLRLGDEPGLVRVGEGDFEAMHLQLGVDLDPEVAGGLDDGSDLARAL